MRETRQEGRRQGRGNDCGNEKRSEAHHVHWNVIGRVGISNSTWRQDLKIENRGTKKARNIYLVLFRMTYFEFRPGALDQCWMPCSWDQTPSSVQKKVGSTSLQKNINPEKRKREACMKYCCSLTATSNVKTTSLVATISRCLCIHIYSFRIFTEALYMLTSLLSVFVFVLALAFVLGVGF